MFFCTGSCVLIYTIGPPPSTFKRQLLHIIGGTVAAAAVAFIFCACLRCMCRRNAHTGSVVQTNPARISGSAYPSQPQSFPPYPHQQYPHQQQQHPPSYPSPCPTVAYPAQPSVQMPYPPQSGQNVPSSTMNPGFHGDISPQRVYDPPPAYNVGAHHQ